MCQLLYQWYTWTLLITMEFGFSTAQKEPDISICVNKYTRLIEKYCNPCDLHTSCYSETSYDHVLCKFIPSYRTPKLIHII